MSSDVKHGADDARARVHPDEGAIHAWLDGEQPPVVADAIAEHVQECAECAERVAEARGLIAGASRVVAALDEGAAQPAPVVLAPLAPPPSAGGTLWRALRVTPARAAIAATLLVGVGITLTRREGVVERIAPAASETSDLSSGDGAQSAAAPVPMRDALLDSAIRRRVAAEQPPRAVEALPSPLAAESRAASDGELRARVAAGRSAAAAARETTTAASKLADRTAAPAAVLQRALCWRVERSGAEAAEPSWLGDRLPVVVDPGGAVPGVGDTLRIAVANRLGLILGPMRADGARAGELRAFDRAGALVEWRVSARPASCRGE